jgi:hypothetical protein
MSIIKDIAVEFDTEIMFFSLLKGKKKHAIVQQKEREKRLILSFMNFPSSSAIPSTLSLVFSSHAPMAFRSCFVLLL